jgi:hypothetical protein
VIFNLKGNGKLAKELNGYRKNVASKFFESGNDVSFIPCSQEM